MTYKKRYTLYEKRTARLNLLFMKYNDSENIFQFSIKQEIDTIILEKKWESRSFLGMIIYIYTFSTQNLDIT